MFRRKSIVSDGSLEVWNGPGLARDHILQHVLAVHVDQGALLAPRKFSCSRGGVGLLCGVDRAW